MAVRGARRRRGYERGFVLSDHADWPGLLHTIRSTGARQIYVTHGSADSLSRYLREVEGVAAEPLEGAFAAERGDHLSEEPAPPAGLEPPTGRPAEVGPSPEAPPQGRP
jgi:putative mRNA 3-end processing factor